MTTMPPSAALASLKSHPWWSYYTLKQQQAIEDEVRDAGPGDIVLLPQPVSVQRPFLHRSLAAVYNLFRKGA